MTNILDTAADILESGWCKGGMCQTDGKVMKFCSVGAVAAADLGFTVETLNPNDGAQRYDIETYAWAEAEHALDKNHPALVALSDELNDSGLYVDDDWDPWNKVMDWNDSQKQADVVIATFRNAARRLDS
jgi:ATP:corrinoid adenosyltransferase